MVKQKTIIIKEWLSKKEPNKDLSIVDIKTGIKYVVEAFYKEKMKTFKELVKEL